MAIYGLLVLMFVTMILPAPYLSYLGLVFLIAALLLADRIKKSDKPRGNRLTIISIIVFVISIISGIFVWSALISSFL